MFMGVSSYERTPRVRCYEDAKDALKGQRERKTGKVTSLRQTLSGYKPGIACRLYDTDVVIWHEDGTFTLEPYPTATTARFVAHYLPGFIWTDQKGLITWHDGGGWQDARVCTGTATWTKTDEGWRPDESMLDDMVYLDLDRRVARAVSKEHNLADFTSWLSMAPRHMELVHNREDPLKVADALIDRDFKTAAMHLPLVEAGKGFGNEKRFNPLPIETGSRWRRVTMSSVARVRDWLYDEADALHEVKFKVLPLREFRNRQKRLSALQSRGIDAACGLGVF